MTNFEVKPLRHFKSAKYQPSFIIDLLVVPDGLTHLFANEEFKQPGKLRLYHSGCRRTNLAG